MAKLTLSEKLFESNKKLNEAFSDSMPDWLRGHLLPSIVNKNIPGYTASANQNRQKAYDKYNKKYDLDALKGRRQYGKDLSGDRYNSDAIFRGMNKYHIDFSRANFIHGEPPTKSTDPRMQKPNQAFILIEFGGEKQVYAPGLNDKDITIFPIANKYAPANTFKYARFSDYKDYIKDFYYVNTADPANSNDNLTSQRAHNDLYMNDAQMQGLERITDKSRAQNAVWSSGGRIDKSGYLVNPKRYKDALRKAQKSNYAKKLEQSYNILQDVKETLTNYIIEADAADSDALDFASNIMRRDLSSAINKYNRLASAIESAEQQWDPSSPEFSSFLDSIFSRYGDVEYLDNALASLERAVSSIKFVDFDW